MFNNFKFYILTYWKTIRKDVGIRNKKKKKKFDFFRSILNWQYLKQMYIVTKGKNRRLRQDANTALAKIWPKFSRPLLLKLKVWNYMFGSFTHMTRFAVLSPSEENVSWTLAIESERGTLPHGQRLWAHCWQTWRRWLLSNGHRGLQWMRGLKAIWFNKMWIWI